METAMLDPKPTWVPWVTVPPHTHLKSPPEIPKREIFIDSLLVRIT
jgi:hypothetical protein